MIRVMPHSVALRTSARVSRTRRALPAGALVVALVVTTAVTALTTPPGPDRAPAPLLRSGPVVEYRLPVDDVVVRRFERPAHRWSPGHRGIDIEAPAATPVRAPGDGVVTFSGTVVDRGVLTIEHPDGLRSSLEPLVDAVPAGTRVHAGVVVGAVADGGTHCAPGDCLHWGVRRGEVYLDPFTLLPGASPIVLLARTTSSSGRSPGASPASGAWPPCASARCVTR
jgi:murein DD-endopeptidase MepM/ murein hydrolase activator NlpD